MNSTPSVLKAFALLNKQENNNENTTTSTLMPTAKSRKALDILINSTPDEVKDLQLKSFLQDIFNWDGNNHVNKPLIRIFSESLNDPKKYSQTVEFTGYVAALAPMLEADQISRMYAAVEETCTAFAPTLYTINFNSNLKRAFAGLSSQRVEKIGLSLWNESHNGRWWNMTAGINNVQENQGHVEPHKILETLHKYNDSRDEIVNMENIIWSPQNQSNFKKYMDNRLDKKVAMLSETFRRDLMEGKAVTPDIAIFLSAIDWLAPNQRPESPINSLVKNLVYLREEDESFLMPKKPNSIKDLFPNFELSIDKSKYDFPFDPAIIKSVQEKALVKHLNENDIKKFNLITSKSALAQNAKHMGNCTLTYQNNMEKGKYALIYLEYKKESYNAAIRLNGDSWRLGEINTRYNRGGVLPEVRQAFQKQVDSLPKITPEYKRYIKDFDGKETKAYAYIL